MAVSLVIGRPVLPLRREVGSLPGTDGLLSTKEILTRCYKAEGTTLTPIM